MSTADSSSDRPAILLVDDDENGLLLTRHTLQRLGLAGALIEARNGEDAVAYLCAALAPGGARRPDLILLDLNMPNMDGFELLEWLASEPELARIPAFMFSGSNNPLNRDRALKLGARGYIPRPTSLDEFRELIGSICRRPPDQPSSSATSRDSTRVRFAGRARAPRTAVRG